MKLPQISAGEFFELLRPAAYLLAALLSAWVLASARRQGIRFYLALLLALGTFLLPFVVLPLYLVGLIFRKISRRNSLAAERESPAAAEFLAPRIRFRILLPAAYGFLLLGGTALYLYRDNNQVDAYLARANQAKLTGPPTKVIREYRAALSLEDNPHTHKLLGIELAGAGQWNEALSEFRLAEQNGEPDQSLPFRMALALNAIGDLAASRSEYQRFLSTHLCTQQVPDEQCAAARRVLLENDH